MFKFIKKMFHKHDIVWELRKPIENVTVDLTTGPVIDIVRGTKYLYKGRCLTCGEKITKIEIIAGLFDRAQPYDVTKDI